MGRRNKRTLARAAAASTVLAVLATLGQATAEAAETTMVVGIGDSFGSGEGAGLYDIQTDTDTNQCHRSLYAWQWTATIPNPVGDVRREHVACSGATTANVLSQAQGRAPGEGPQIGVLDRTNPNIVLVSIGGNDLGFSKLIEDCVAFVNCVSSGGISIARNKIPFVKTQVRAVLDDVVWREPQATVVLAGYPQLIQGDCSWFDRNEADGLDLLSRDVRTAWVEQVMALRMLGKKVRFLDTIDPFKGHGACSPEPWINPVDLLPGGQLRVESMHPNAAGNQAYATATTNVLRTDPMRCDARGCRIRFADESVYYSLAQASRGAQTVHGSIRSAYESEGEERGWLGYPKTGELVEPANGRSQQFEGGTYWWRSGVGAYPVKGRILAKYVAINDVATIGTPMSKEIDVTGGRIQYFSSGWMFFKFGTAAAFYSKGEILKKYRALGTTTGGLGWPTTDEGCGLQPGNGCRQRFDGSGGSIIYWSSATGAHSVTGAIRAFYASTGYQNSHPDWLSSTVIAGYPTTDRYVSNWLGEPLVMQDFQVGRIVVDTPTTSGQPVCWYMPGRSRPRGFCDYVA